MVCPVWSGMLQIGIRASVFNTKPGWAEKVGLKKNVIEDLFQGGQILSYRMSMVSNNKNWEDLGKSPNLCC
jgi:hypothetical protein